MATRRVQKTIKKLKISQKEAAFLFDKLESEEHAEEVWSEMISPPPDEAQDFESVEEQILKQSHEHDSSLRSWKYFGK